MDVAFTPHGERGGLAIRGSLFPNGSEQYVALTFNAASLVGNFIPTESWMPRTRSLTPPILLAPLAAQPAPPKIWLGNDVYGDAAVFRHHLRVPDLGWRRVTPVSGDQRRRRSRCRGDQSDSHIGQRHGHHEHDSRSKPTGRGGWKFRERIRHLGHRLSPPTGSAATRARSR